MQPSGFFKWLFIKGTSVTLTPLWLQYWTIYTPLCNQSWKSFLWRPTLSFGAVNQLGNSTAWMLMKNCTCCLLTEDNLLTYSLSLNIRLFVFNLV